MLAGVFVLHSGSLQEVLENNFTVLKWFSGEICVVVLPVQAWTWVSDLVLSFHDQCWEIFLLKQSHSAHTIVLLSCWSHLYAHPWLSAAQEIFLPLVKPNEGPSRWTSVEPCAWQQCIISLRNLGPSVEAVSRQDFSHSVSLQEVPLQGVPPHV